MQLMSTILIALPEPPKQLPLFRLVDFLEYRCLALVDRDHGTVQSRGVVRCKKSEELGHILGNPQPRQAFSALLRGYHVRMVSR